MRARLLELLKVKAFEQKEVTLASGKKSNFYIDVKRVSLLAEGAALIGECLFNLISQEYPGTTAVGGLTLGADPLATSVAITSWKKGKPMESFIVRKESKEHGLKKLIEGTEAIEFGANVVVLEDVVTSGSSSLDAAKKVQDQGWHVLGIAAVVDRCDGGEALLAEHGLKLKSLFKREDFLTSL